MKDELRELLYGYFLAINKKLYPNALMKQDWEVWTLEDVTKFGSSETMRKIFYRNKLYPDLKSIVTKYEFEQKMRKQLEE